MTATTYDAETRAFMQQYAAEKQASADAAQEALIDALHNLRDAADIQFNRAREGNDVSLDDLWRLVNRAADHNSTYAYDGKAAHDLQTALDEQ